MAEQRRKTHHILLSTGSKVTALELFDARLWPGQTSDDGEFRVRIDGCWYSPAGKYTFLTFAAVGALVARLLSGQDAFVEEARPPVSLRPGQRVSVDLGDCVGSVPLRTEGGFVAAPPYRGVDGRWYVYVRTYDGTASYPCHDVQPAGR